jgi:tetratricopeptide (TPR) repeat protein
VNVLSKIFISVLLVTASSCSTLSGLRKTKDNPDDNALVGAAVISKPGAKSPTISAADEQKWIELSQSTQPGRDKLNGLLATGKWQEASEEARRELEKQPGDIGAMTALAAAQATGRNYEMAGYYAGIILKSNPSHADALNLLGLRWMMGAGNRRQDLDEAISIFRKATESDGTHIAAALNMGYLQLDIGDSQGALESFSLAKTRCGQCFEAEYGAGLAAMRAANWPQAKSTFEGILSRDKSRAAAQYQLALVMSRGFNDVNKSTDLLQNLVSDPDGRFKDAGAVKRAANITLRRLRATDGSAPPPEETIEPRGGERPARTKKQDQ